MKTAFIFPAFISEYLGNEVQLLDALSSNLHAFLKEASLITEVDYTNISLDDILYTEDELRSQIITYIFSCSLSEVLIKKGLKPDIMAGYSMGLYATMFTGGAIDFKDGIELIKQAYIISKSVIGNIESAMGSIIGLTNNEIEEIISENNLKAEVANTNSLHSHLVTGSSEAVNILLNKAREIGALNISFLQVSTPYHSKLLIESGSIFQEYIQKNIKINRSQFPIISCIDQKVIDTPSQISDEIINNLYTRINWMKTFDKMRSLGVRQFIECGAGKSLHKIGRFMPGNFTIYPMNRVNKLF